MKWYFTAKGSSVFLQQFFFFFNWQVFWMIESIWLWIPCLLNALAENVGEIFTACLKHLNFLRWKLLMENCLRAWCIRRPSSFVLEKINKQTFQGQMPIIHDLEICTFQAKHFSLICWVHLFNTYWVHWWVQKLETSIKPWAKPCGGWSQGAWRKWKHKNFLPSSGKEHYLHLANLMLHGPAVSHKQEKSESSFWYFA